MHPSETFGCGHPRTPKNSVPFVKVRRTKSGEDRVYEYEYCRLCHNAKNAERMRAKYYREKRT